MPASQVIRGMEQSLYIRGGKRLEGRVRISGAKNAALPIMVACLLSDQKINLQNIPMLSDTQDMALLLRDLGVDAQLEQGHAQIHAAKITKTVASEYYVRRIRASMLIMGALLAREGCVKMVQPGGDAIGVRPLNWHMMALEKLGARVETEGEAIFCKLDKPLCGAKIVFPEKTVGGTETALMVSCMARGPSEIHNGAEEPEISDLVAFLKQLGADIEEKGQGVFHIAGDAVLGGGDYRIIADRIEAGSFAMAVAATKGRLFLENIPADYLAAPMGILRQIGVDINVSDQAIEISNHSDSLQSIDIDTMPFPGFPTDLQAQFMALMCLGNGVSLIRENIFENRFKHVSQLNKMGADISIDGNLARVAGGRVFKGTNVMASDIRACFSLIIAALAGEGESRIDAIHHIDRGYESLVSKLFECGADIGRKP